MPKRKRSRSKESDYDSILKKMKKLERKIRKKRRERSISVHSNSSRSNFDPDYPGGGSPNPVINLDDEYYDEEHPVQSEPPPTPPPPPSLPPVEAAPPPPPPIEAAPGAPSFDTITDTREADATVNLEPDIINLLGEDYSNKKSYGISLHKDIALRWTHILTNGLAKDIQADLVKQYLLPENCVNLSAPKLNPEIKKAMSELNVKQDQYSQGKQNQLGSGLAALGQVLNWALTSKNIVPPDIIKALSDAGRLFCDNHYRESLSRRYAALNALNRDVRDTVKDAKIEENLFGSNLSDHIKSCKAITKTASEMKTAYRTPYQAPPPNRPQRGALNSRGNPRAAAIEPRTAPAPRRPPPPPAPPRDRRQPPAARGRQQATGYSRQQRRRY